MLIDGKLVEAASGATFANINPFTEQEIGQIADACEAEMDEAIGAARRAFDETDWATNHTFRRRCLEQFRDGLMAEREAIRSLTVAEVGAPYSLTFAVQTDTPIDDLQWVIDITDTYSYESNLPVHEFFGFRSSRRIVREPIGVVGAITPWNYPLQLNLAKAGPALAAGNAVVLKPAPDTPWSATVLGRIVAEQTDIPPGIFNVVPSSNHQLGSMLSSDPRVDMVTFTGSTATGRKVMANAAQTIKKVFLELGGKSAHIICDDADFEEYVPVAAGSISYHAGQGCAMTTRLLLPRSRYEEGVELAIRGMGEISYGDPADANNLMGPLISAVQRERVLGYIEKGKAEGARLVVGGGRPAHLPTGYFVEPTLFVDVDPDSTIAQEEIFGPVMVVIPYDDDDDAVRIANNSIYGLSGGVASASEERAIAIARRLRTGTVAINRGLWFGPDSPFGGYKQSGLGREMGVPGFEEYLETKTLGLPA